MIPLGPVVARGRTKASRAVVWSHLTDSKLRQAWWDGLHLEPGLGGAVRSTSGPRTLSGVIDVWVAGHAVGFTWNGEDDERGTAVLITLRSQGYLTGVTVTETGFDALPDAAARAELAGQVWSGFVTDLAEASLVDIEAEPAADVELAPLEIEGEFAEAAETDPIEVDAEPGLGDHLELVTGPIDLPNEAETSESNDTEPSALNEHVSEDIGEEESFEGVVPLILPEPTDDTMVIDAVEAADDEPEEPDFDSLMRGH